MFNTYRVDVIGKQTAKPRLFRLEAKILEIISDCYVTQLVN